MNTFSNPHHDVSTSLVCTDHTSTKVATRPARRASSRISTRTGHLIFSVGCICFLAEWTITLEYTPWREIGRPRRRGKHNITFGVFISATLHYSAFFVHDRTGRYPPQSKQLLNIIPELRRRVLELGVVAFGGSGRMEAAALLKR